MSLASRSTIVKYTFAAAAGVALASLLDRWAYEHLIMRDVYEREWGRMLRAAGYVPLWVIVALGTTLARGPVRSWRHLATAPVAFVVYAATLGNLIADPLKLIIRRERPDAAHGAYVFRAFSDHTVSSGGFGMPSSHSLVAFSAAAMLALLYPRGRVLWFAIAAGCGLTRVLAGVHFVSDVALSAALGPVVAACVAWLARRKQIQVADLGRRTERANRKGETEERT